MLFWILSWLITSFLNGLFFFIIFSALLYWFYFKELPVQAVNNEPQFEKFVLSQTLTDMLASNSVAEPTTTTATASTNQDQNTDTPSQPLSREGLTGNSDAIIGLNMIFQFLFQELKDTKGVRRYIIRKLSYEFNELLTTKAAGKLLQKISARDFSLGTSFPVFHDLKLNSYELDKEKKTIQEMSVLVDLEYKNGFSLSIDADLILGRSAYVHIKIVSITGKARLQFTRHPFTHWNFAFIDEPQIEFDASSHFDGRQIPQLTQLILNQLRRAVRRKHTLPNYKCRYKPFFDQIYNQNLYRADLDELLRKRSSSEANGPLTRDESSSKDKVTGLEKPKSLTLKNAGRLKSISTSYQYQKLCDKLGFDLTSRGKLSIYLADIERLPEALYSLNLPVLSQQQQPQQQQQQQPANQSGNQSNQSSIQQPVASTELDTFIYMTTSIDTISMKSLMDRQICKDHWPLFEFELIKTTNDIGLEVMDIFFVNKNEVVIQRISPNTPAYAFSKQIKRFDIIHSVNQAKVHNVKGLNKLIQKALINSVLKFAVQRPCIQMENVVMTSARSVSTSLSQSSSKVDLPPKPKTEQPAITVATSSANNTEAASITSSTSEPLATTSTKASVPIPIPSSSGSNATTSSIMTNTRQKIENLFGEKTKLKILFQHKEPLAISNTHSLSPAHGTELTTSASEPSNLTSNSQVASSVSTPTAGTPASVGPPQPLTTASASSLVDFFCTASERHINDDFDLDLMGLLLNESSEVAKKRRTKYYYKKTNQIKLERKNILSFDNIPIDVDETYTFNLANGTKHLNIFLWTTQYLNKMTRMKNILIGYISIPLNEVTVDCWNTTKGETQSSIHFSPLDELKASAISKLSHSHVISDHPGFDSCLSVGSITLKFKHELPLENDQESVRSESSATNGDDLSDRNDEDFLLDDASDPETVSVVDPKDITGTVVEQIVDQDRLAMEFKGELANIGPKGLEQIDDGSIHKFSVINFNEMVVCEFCNRKIWLKKAYKCVYCNYIIHIKCYDKTIGKTICERFYAKNGLRKETATTTSADTNKSIPRITVESEDPFSMLPLERPDQLRKSSTNVQLVMASEHGLEGASLPSTPRNASAMVSNFFSGIRQRKWAPNEEQQSAARPGFLSSFNLGLSSSISRSKSNKSLPDTNVVFDKNNLNLEYLNNMNNLDDSSSVSDVEDYKEFDCNEDKLYGTDLYEDLPLNERRAKFDEQILKYQSNIDMMTKLKSEMDKELKILMSSGRSGSEEKSSGLKNHQIAQTRAQIKNLEEQMKSVVFLLMQCQIGLETCGEVVLTHEEPEHAGIVDEPTTFSIDHRPGFEIYPAESSDSVLTHRKRTDTEKTETES